MLCPYVHLFHTVSSMSIFSQDLQHLCFLIRIGKNIFDSLIRWREKKAVLEYTFQ